MRYHKRDMANDKERGAALITALLFLLLLTLLGTAAMMTSSTEMMISRNDYTQKQAVYAADAGVQEAMAKLDTTGQVTPAPSGLTTWQANPITGRIYVPGGGFYNYSAVITYKLEDNGSGIREDTYHNNGTLNGEIILYNKGFQYAASAVTSAAQGQPVYTITSTSILRSGGAPTTATVVADVSKNVLNVYTPAGLYSAACIDEGGSAKLETDGTAGMPSYMTPCTAGNTIKDASPAGSAGCPGCYQNMTSTSGGQTPYLGVSKADMKALAVSQGGYHYYSVIDNTWSPPITWNIGDATHPKIVYLDCPGHEYQVQSNATGYGILYIDGNLRTAGGFTWNGLTYVTGNLTAATGTANFTGGVMAGGSVTTELTGNVDIKYDKATLDGLTQNAFRMKMLSWKRVYK